MAGYEATYEFGACQIPGCPDLDMHTDDGDEDDEDDKKPDGAPRPARVNVHPRPRQARIITLPVGTARPRADLYPRYPRLSNKRADKPVAGAPCPEIHRFCVQREDEMMLCEKIFNLVSRCLSGIPGFRALRTRLEAWNNNGLLPFAATTSVDKLARTDVAGHFQHTLYRLLQIGDAVGRLQQFMITTGFFTLLVEILAELEVCRRDCGLPPGNVCEVTEPEILHACRNDIEAALLGLEIAKNDLVNIFRPKSLPQLIKPGSWFRSSLRGKDNKEAAGGGGGGNPST